MTTDASLHIAIADPLKTVRAGLGSIISAEDDLDVALEVNSCDELLAQLPRLREPTRVVALVSLSLTGGTDVFSLIRRIREVTPSVSVVAMGEGVERSLVARALFFGADGYLDRHAEIDEFLDGIRASARGEVVLVGSPTDWLGGISEDIRRESDGRSVLSERERQVLTLAASGQTAREIGDELGLRERTITTHFGRIYARLGVHGRVAAIAEGVKLGLIAPPSSAT